MSRFTTNLPSVPATPVPITLPVTSLTVILLFASAVPDTCVPVPLNTEVPKSGAVKSGACTFAFGDLLLDASTAWTLRLSLLIFAEFNETTN